MRFPKDSARFKDLAAGFQSLAFIIAVLIGGVWTAYTFYWNAADRKLKERENLKFSIAVTPLPVEGDDRIVSIRIDAQNSGNYPIDLDFTCDPVRVTRVEHHSNDRFTYSVIERLRPLSYSSRQTSRPEATKYLSTRVRAGGLQSYYFLTQLPSPGLYWITFSAPEKVEGQLACPDKSARPQPDPESPTKRRTDRDSNGGRSLKWATGGLYVSP